VLDHLKHSLSLLLLVMNLFCIISRLVIFVLNANNYIIYLLNQGNYLIFQQKNSLTCINAGYLNVLTFD